MLAYISSLWGCLPTRRIVAVGLASLGLAAALISRAAAEPSPTPPTDFTSLGQPGVADRLGLSDEQRAAIATVLDDRVAQLVQTPVDQRPQVISQSNAKLAAILTPEQIQQFQSHQQSGKLLFNFRQQKWPEVLEWFASQADLSLVMDTPPPGHFTYSDQEEHTPTKAIDLLNSVLISKGFTLVRRDRMLLVIDVTKGVPYDLIPQVSLEQLAERGRFELVSVQFPLGAKPVEGVLTEIQGLLSALGKATPLPQTKQLLVTDTAGRMESINRVIASVPEPTPPAAAAPVPPPPAPIFIPYDAAGLDLKATVEMLGAMFEKAKFQFDANTQQVHAYAPPEQQAAIKSALEQMLAGTDSDKGRRMEIVPVDSIDDVTKLQQQLTVAVPDVAITADVTEKRLLVMGNAAERQKVRDAVAKLTGDAPIQDNIVTVEVYQVSPESTATLTTLLQQMLPRAAVVSQPGRIAVRAAARDQSLAKATLEQMELADAQAPRPSVQFYDLQQPLSDELLNTLKQIVPQAHVTMVDEGRKLSAVALPKEHAQLAETLKQMQAALPPPAERTLQVYPVTESQKQRFQTLLPDLQQALASVKWIAEGSPREIAAFATPAQHVAIGQFLSNLASDSDAKESRTLHRLPIEVRDPARLLTLMQESFPGTKMLLNDQQDAVLVWDHAERLVDYQTRLTELQAQLPAREERVLEIYAVPTQQRIEDLQALLTPVAKEATITPDVPRKRLVIWATAKVHAEIQSVLKKVTQANAQSPAKRLAMYDVIEQEATAILSDIRTAVPNAEVRLDSRNRQLIVTADEEEHAKISELVQQLTSKLQDRERVLIAYPLQHADPESVVPMLKELRPDVQFAADARAKRVLVTAPLREHPRLQAVIEQVDAAPDDASEQRLESYELTLEDPSVILPLLQPLLPRMQLSIDVRGRRLVAKGSELDQQHLARVLGRINRENEQGGTVRAYDTGNADAEQIRNVMRQLAPDAVIAADVVARRVLIWASEEDQSSIAEAMQQFSAQVPGEPRLLKTYPVPPNVGATILPVLQKAVPGAAISLDTQQRLVIGWGTEPQHAILAQATQGLQAPREDATLRLHTAQPAVLQNAKPLVNELVPEAKLVNGADEGKWLVFATEPEQKAIADLIQAVADQLDPSQTSRVIRVYALSARQSEPARQVISQELTTTRQLSSPDPRRLIIQATEDQHARIAELLEEVRKAYPEGEEKTLRTHPVRKDLREAIRTRLSSILPGLELAASNAEDSLSWWASDADHERAQSVIEEFQAQMPAAIEREVRVYELRAATPESVREVLAGTLSNLTFVPTSTPQRIVIQATASQHEKVKQLIEETDQAASTRGESVHVYPISDRLLAQTVMTALDPQLTRGAVVLVNDITNSLIVRAQPETQDRIKVAIESLVAQLPSGPTLAAEVHRFKNANPSTAANVLQTLLPNARFAVDEKAKTLAAAARPADQKLIQLIVQQMEASAPSANLITRIYRMKRASARTAQNTFAMLARDAKVGFDAGSNAVIVTATEEDHTLIADAAEQLDGGPEGSLVQVYAFEPEQVKAEVVLRSLDEALRESVAIQVNEPSNSLIVRGSEESHERVRMAIEAIEKQLPTPRQLVTQVYPLKLANPDVVRDALIPLLPQGRASSDPASGSVIVSAFPTEQARIQEVVQRLDVVPDRQPLVKAYPILNAKGQGIFQSVSQALSGNRDVSVSYQQDTNTLFVVAPPRYQQVAAELLQTIDRTDQPTRERTAKAYRLKNIDGLAASTAVNALFVNQQPTVTAQFDATSNSMMVVATSQQHAEVAIALEQLQGEERQMEVFELRHVQTFVVEDAIRRLYGRSQQGAPQVSGDADSQRLFVRGTAVQVEEIKKLLEKMGETPSDQLAPLQSGNIRSIPFTGDIDSALQQIRELWPQLRQNQIEVIHASPPKAAVPGNQVLEPLDAPASRRHVEPAERGAPGPSPDDATQGSPARRGGAWRPVQLTAPIGAVAPDSESSPPSAAPIPSPGPELDRRPADAQPPAEDHGGPSADLPPVVIVPDPDRITIASADEQALDELERLLRTLAQRQGQQQGSNFAVFLLRNAGASDVVELLTDLFDRLPESRSGIGEAVFVADERLNALVVHGTPKERAVVKEILRVLDTEDLPDPLNSQRPELIPLKNSAVQQILPVLQSIYKTQLSSGGGRRPMPIPEGVSSEVALVLQQINAATSGPVLTLGADSTTNAIVMRAPLELGREIIAFVEKLDQRAGTTGQHVRIISLEQSDSEAMERALRNFLRRASNR